MIHCKNGIDPKVFVEVALAEFWESIYPNLDYVSIEQKGNLYRQAKKKALASVKGSKMKL